jgi:hypothetical protein
MLTFLQNMTVVHLEKKDQENGFVISEQRCIHNHFSVNFCKISKYTSIRKSLVGKTMPTPTELLNVRPNLANEKFLNSLSDSLATFPVLRNA